VILRIFLWNLADSKTSLDELRDRLPKLEGEGSWISNEANERFGLITYEDEPAVVLAHVRDLIGRHPDVAEEFDVEG
jgi:hypothetical protein